MIRSIRLRDGDHVLWTGGLKEYKSDWPFRRSGNEYRFLAGNAIIERAAKVGVSDIHTKGSKRKLGLLNEIMLENGGWVLMEGQ